MAVLVDAATEHPFPITVTVPIESAAKPLADISDSLDQPGLPRGDHWSLEAQVDGQDVHLRFALNSHASADQLQVVIDATLDQPLTPQLLEQQVGFGIGGSASAKFLDVFRIPRSTEMQVVKFQEPTDT